MKSELKQKLIRAATDAGKAALTVLAEHALRELQRDQARGVRRPGDDTLRAMLN